MIEARRRTAIVNMSREAAVALVLEIHDILFPPEHDGMDADGAQWEGDTIEFIANAVLIACNRAHSPAEQA